MPATKEQIRQIITDNNLNSVADVYSLLKGKRQIIRLLLKQTPLLLAAWFPAFFR